MRNPVAAIIGDPSGRPTPRAWDWVKESKIMAIGWTAMRIWLGIMWIQAGAAKLWGAESAGFIHNNGAGVAGFAAHGTPAYTWWGTFLHGFVVPNAGWIGVLIAVAEFAIGVALVSRLVHPARRARQPRAAVHLRNVRNRQRVRVLRALRGRDPHYVADLELDRARRAAGQLPAAPPGRPPPYSPAKNPRGNPDTSAGQSRIT